MKKIIYLIILVIIVFFGYKYFISPVNSEKPDLATVETMLKEFLLDKNRSKCSGNLSINYLKNVEVGEYDSSYMGGSEGAWPIYAFYDISCNGKSIDKDLNDNQDKVAVTAMRKTRSGNIEFFQPKVISDFGKMLESSL